MTQPKTRQTYKHIEADLPMRAPGCRHAGAVQKENADANLSLRSLALKGDYEELVWDHLAGTVSASFAAGEHGQIAVKGIDQRGNELLLVKRLEERR